MATKVAIKQREMRAIARIRKALGIEEFPFVKGDYAFAVQLEAIADAAERLQRTERSLEDMTVKQLEVYASENGIDLQGASRKADIIAAIEEAELLSEVEDTEDG